MNKKEEKKMLTDNILFYKQKVKQTPEVKKIIHNLQQKLDKLDDKPK